MTTRVPRTLPLDAALQQAIAHQQAGQLREAEQLYRAILQTQPDQPDANHNLGVLAAQLGQYAAGLSYLKTALAIDPSHGQYALSYAETLLATGQANEALRILQRAMQRGLDTPPAHSLRQRAAAATQNAIAAGESPAEAETSRLATLFNSGRYVEMESLARLLVEQHPDSGLAWKGLSASLYAQGKDALTTLRKAAELLPKDADSHYNLGVALQGLGQFDSAVGSYRRALEIRPDYTVAHNNLGNALQDLGQIDDAVASYRRALEIKPDFADAHNNLGNALGKLGQFDNAAASHRRALEIKPAFADAHNNLALLLNAQGKPVMALNEIKRSLEIQETSSAKRIFIDCVNSLRLTQNDSEIRAAMVRALTEPWGRPGELARVCTDLVKLDPDIGKCVARATNAWPRRLSAPDLFGSNGLTAIAADTLLCALLDATSVCDIEMEHFLTLARHTLIEAATGPTASGGGLGSVLRFYGGLARQCFINEYAFSYTDDEIRKAGDLRDSLVAALQANTRVPVLWPVAVAAYFPLCSLPHANGLLGRQWPEEIAAVLTQQIREPEEERQIRATIPRLTGIDDEVSLRVQNQYQENPYPRWIKVAPAGKAESILGLMCLKFPLANFKRHGKSGSIDVLIAGCGTGQHSIETAQQLRDARVLAVDLSLDSLCYAKRKTQERGLTSIEYAQADLLQLGSLGRSFDVIEAAGVLHHLASPWTGWQVLLSLLRPGGFMRLGFYSKVARRNIVRIRDLIAEEGYGTTPHEIRRCRQQLMDLDKSADFGTTIRSADFFSTSTCRDLLFHVQEHRMTLTDIDAFLREHNLAFLGFDIGAEVLRAYRLRFPDDCAATNLGQWQIFESENPDIFIGMYQFWIQKAG